MATLATLASAVVNETLYTIVADHAGRAFLHAEGIRLCPVRRDARSLPPYVVGGVDATEKVRRALAASARKLRA